LVVRDFDSHHCLFCYLIVKKVGSGNFHPIKGATLYDVLGDKPREENPETAEVAINGMSRETSILGVVKAMSGETPLLQ